MTTQSTTSNLKTGCRLWIDGVGCWSLWLGDSLTIGGGVGSSHSEADYVLQAPLSRKHAFVLRTELDYQIVPLSTTLLNGSTIEKKTFLTRRSQIQLGSAVDLQFELPNELSRSARITCMSPHRTVDRSDGLILVCDHVMLGQGAAMHIPCRAATDTLLLFQRQGNLWCRPLPDLLLDGQPVNHPQPLRHGSLLAGAGISFRLEVN